MEKNKSNFTSLSVRPADMKEFKRLHKRFDAGRKSYDFFREVLSVYKSFHCPECLSEMKPKTCICKESEKL